MKYLTLVIAMAILHLNVFGMTITVNTSSGTTFTLDVEASESIEEVKIKIETQEGISQSLQFLYLDDVEFEDDKTISDYNIQKGVVLELKTSYVLTVDDVTFDTSTNTITEYLSTTKRNIEIPDSFTVDGDKHAILHIGSGAFNSVNLTGLILPTGLLTIDSKAFWGGNFTEITIPNTVTSIGSQAFYNGNLTSIDLGSSVKTIGYSCFGNGDLTEVTIPNSVTSIDKFAFSSNKLTHVTLNNTLTYLGGGCFTTNYITTVNGQASTGLFYGRNEDASVDSSIVVSYGGTTRVMDFISDKVTEIAQYAFDGCALTSVTLPKNLITIQYRAFYYNAFTTIAFPSSLSYIGSSAFSSTQIDSISLPNAEYDGYTTYWKYGGDTVTNFVRANSSAYTLINTAIDYTITYHTNGGTHSNATTYTIESDDIVLGDAIKDGHTFTAWYTDENLTNKLSTIAAHSYGDIELWASYAVPTAIDDNNQPTAFKVYPSIASTTISISGVEANTPICIYNLQGLIVKQLVVEGDTESINIASLPTGAYLIKAGHATQRFMIER